MKRFKFQTECLQKKTKSSTVIIFFKQIFKEQLIDRFIEAITISYLLVFYHYSVIIDK